MKLERDKLDTIESIPAYVSVNAARSAGELSTDRSSQRGLSGSICSQDSPLLAFSYLPTGLLENESLPDSHRDSFQIDQDTIRRFGD
jgi:hypothetical protein